MSDLLTKCAVCGALLDEEDLFCAECGTEAPDHQQSVPLAHQLSTHNFQCQGCGASMSYDAKAGALRCPFCGSENMQQQADTSEIAPQGVVPFAISHEEVLSRLKNWLADGFWRPGDLAKAAAVVKMTPVYVPFWVFSAKTKTHWTADSSRTPAGARGDWYPLSGTTSGIHSGVLVGASSVLTPAEITAMGDFDLSTAIPPQDADLNRVTYERFAMQRKYARPFARAGLESREMQRIAPTIPGNNRNLKVNTRITDLTSQPLLLPIWVMAYRYQDNVYRFVANGQTGRSTGKAPNSMWKIGSALGAALIALIVLLLVIMSSLR
ncbi:MAG: zinc ribbon domain-containing protein [Planctomycetota bacterium]|nr:zinc ribbon domain-containing protein [Planctomycetota bacterium]